MKYLYLLATLFVLPLSTLLVGCNKGVGAATDPDQTATASRKSNPLENQLAGRWEVTEWICDTGDGPFNFERNLGWKFEFQKGKMKLDKNGKDTTEFNVHLIPNTSPPQVRLIAEMDFDEDGKTDITIQRNCILKFEESKLIMVYGSFSTNISLDTGDANSLSGIPTRFIADNKGSLVTLKKTN